MAGVDAALDIFKADLAYPISRLPEVNFFEVSYLQLQISLRFLLEANTSHIDK